MYKVLRIGLFAYGVYKKNNGAAGGWHLIKTFNTEEECNQYILTKS